eukprot:Skav201325  [mRNA]  locus=scaffold6732:699:1439:- [translate_table: standard]
MRCLMKVSQLHPVEVMDQSWLRNVVAKDRGMATYLQGLLRNQELAQWWRLFARDGFDRERFRLTYTVPTSYSNEGTTETNTWPKDTYARNSRMLEACESTAFHQFALLMADALEQPVPAEDLEAVTLKIPGVGAFVSTCILEAAEAANLLRNFESDTCCFGTNTFHYLKLLAPTSQPHVTLQTLTKKVQELCPKDQTYQRLACPRLIQRSCCKVLQLLKCIKTGKLKNCRRVRAKIQAWSFQETAQ